MTEYQTHKSVNIVAFVSPFVFLMDRPEFLLLLLEQGELTLEDQTRLFLEISNLTSYQDDVLCAFYIVSINIVCRATL